MQTVHIESSFVYPLTRAFMAVGCIWASRRCQILDSDIVRDFRVALGLAAIGALDDSIVGWIVLGSIVRSTIVGSIVGSAIIASSVGSAISTLETSHILFFPFSVVDTSAVVGTIIYMPLISFPARL